MTENQKLDLIIINMQGMQKDIKGMQEEIKGIKKDINSLRRQVVKSTVELRDMDGMILDEVERVHGILERHKANKAVHTV